MLPSRDQSRPQTLDDLLPAQLAATIDRLDLHTRKVFAGKLQGERRSKRRGQSVEFDDYRNYVPGDDLRRIDWNVFARLDRFFVKIFQEEQDLSLHLIIDASPSMDTGAPNKLNFAMRLAMALSYIALTHNDRVVIWSYGAGALRHLEPLRGRRHVPRIGSFLIETANIATRNAPQIRSGSTEASFAETMRKIAVTRAGKGVMVLLSDLLIAEGFQDGLRMFGGQGPSGFDMYCLQILSPGELDPASEAEHGLVGDLRLVDSETSRHAEVTLSADLLSRYRQRVIDYCDDLGRFCRARDMHYALLPSNTDLAELLVDDLRRHGMLK